MATKRSMGCGGKNCFVRLLAVPTRRAKVLHSEWEAEIDSRIEALRAKRRDEGRDLTQREAQAPIRRQAPPTVGATHSSRLPIGTASPTAGRTRSRATRR